MSRAKQTLREIIYKNIERKMEQAMQATPPEELYEYLMDSSIPKTEAEHYAARRIEELEAALPEQVCEWVQWPGDESTYDACEGESWTFMEGDLQDNRISHCPFCGKPIKEVSDVD